MQTRMNTQMIEAKFLPLELFGLNEEGKSFLRRCVDIIIMLSSVYGFDTSGYSRKGTYEHWFYCASVFGDPMKFVKWKIASYYASHKSQEVAPHVVLAVDNPKVLCGGRLYRFLRVMERDNPSLFASFITSVLKSKKGMPRPNTKKIESAVKDTIVKLTKPVIPRMSFLIDWADIVDEKRKYTVESTLTKDSMIRELKRTVNELFSSDVTYSRDDRIEPFFPSTSANYINSRSFGGVIGTILDDPEILNGLTDLSSLISTHVSRSSRNVSINVDTSLLREHFTVLYDRICERALTEEPTASPVGLAEALKVRVITKGPPYLYTMLRPLQQKMWKTLHSHPCFQLVGQPVTAEYIQQRMGSKLGAREAFLSIDYTDATNEMMSFVSNVIADQISDNLELSEIEHKLFLKALTGHLIEDVTGDYSLKEQTMGQLMGSIVSFPVLCIANAAICRWAKELSTNRHWTLRDCPLAINGDDAVLKTDMEGRLAWEKIGAFCGLSPSIGKVYFSRDFLNINSTTYDFNVEGIPYTTMRSGVEVSRRHNFILVNDVNMGLLFSLKRSGGAFSIHDNNNSESFGSRATTLIKNAPSEIQERLLCQFIALQKKKLSQVRVPWFIPEQFGGLGLPPVGKYQPNDHDLRLARMIYEHPEDFKLPRKPLDAPWMVWQYACKRFKKLPTFAPSSTMEFYSMPNESHKVVSESHVLGLFCVEALFTVDDISELYGDSVNRKAMRRFVRQRTQVWKSAMVSNIPFPEPFNQENYPTLHNVSNIPYIYEHLRRSHLIN